MILSSVDFPQPEGPTKITNSPSAYGKVDPMQHLGCAKRLGHRFQLERAQLLSLSWFHHLTAHFAGVAASPFQRSQQALQ